VATPSVFFAPFSSDLLRQRLGLFTPFFDNGESLVWVEVRRLLLPELYISPTEFED
jgi:hypothetical protein